MMITNEDERRTFLDMAQLRTNSKPPRVTNMSAEQYNLEESNMVHIQLHWDRVTVTEQGSLSVAIVMIGSILRREVESQVRD